MTAFTFNYKIRLDDLDYMGIVGNADWLTILERARTDLLQAIGFPIETLVAANLGGVVAEIAVKYLRPARLGDTINVAVTVNNLGRSSGILAYVVTDARQREVLRAESRLVIVDGNGRPASMPDAMRAALH